MKFLPDEPALLIDELESTTLVIADLHLGIEYEIYRKGVKIPPRMERQKSRILELVEESSAERLVLLGDIKHNVPTMSIGEKENLPDFFRSLSDAVKEVVVVKGNHDGNIEDLVDESTVSPASGIKLGDFYFIHGHAWPDRDVLEAKLLVLGHSHPAMVFEDRLGFSSTLPSWIRGGVDCDVLGERYGSQNCDLEEFVMVPTFNRMIDGSPVNRKTEERSLGPLAENNVIDLKESEAYLLDGTYLGKVKNV